jgi:hypothetical protein
MHFEFCGRRRPAKISMSMVKQSYPIMASPKLLAQTDEQAAHAPARRVK